MIVDINLENKNIVVIGGGNEAQKRINSVLKQQGERGHCTITVITDSANAQIAKLGKTKKIKLIKQKIKDIKPIMKLNPSIIITTTNDRELNQSIIRDAKKSGVMMMMVYSSDNPEESDFSNPAIIDFEGTVQVAIFTGGQSPAMSKKIKEKSEKALQKIITSEDIAQIKIQKTARRLAKDIISSQKTRRERLQSIINDREIDQLIKDGQLKKAEKRAIAILRNEE